MSVTEALSFGVLLKQLRKRAGMTQRDLAAALGYSDSLISSLEKAQRQPDLETVIQRLIPALGLQDDPTLAAYLLECAAIARGEQPPATHLFSSAQQKPSAPQKIKTERAKSAHRLPALPVELIGRSETVQQLSNRLLGHGGRLLTLVGPPGVGKTTLALAVATQVQQHYADGAHFIPLAAIHDATLMAATIVAQVAPGDSSNKPPQTRVIEILRNQSTLLLLDNLEQIEGAASLIATLLTDCPTLTILATSRERLHLRAEQRFKVPPLDLNAAVALFVQRAQAVDGDFILTSDNQPTVAAICQRLDCLPLAIELSAVQVDFFSLAPLLARLEKQRLDLLANGLHDLSTHHQTLRQAIHRSYILLNEQERALFRALGVFEGGFDLPAVTYMGFGEALLQALVNKSLVSIEHRELSERRFLYLETVHEYAHELLRAADELTLVSEQHAKYFLKLSEEAILRFGSRTERRWLGQLTCDHANLRSALGWWIRFDPVIGQQMASQLYGFWFGTGHFAEGHTWLAKAVAADTQSTPSRAQALLAAAKLAQDQSNNRRALLLAQESLAIFETQNNPADCIDALYVIGWALAEMDQTDQAVVHFERSLALARKTEQLGLVAFGCINVANMLIRLGAPHSQIKSLLQEGKFLCHQIDHPSGIAYALRSEALLYFMAGDYVHAEAFISEALALLRSAGVQWEVAHALVELADTLWRMGNEVAAYTHLTEALKFFQENEIELGLIEVWYDFGQIERCVRHNPKLATDYYSKSLMLCWKNDRKKLFGRALFGLASVAQAQGDISRAARLIAMAQKLFAGHPPVFAPSDLAEYEKLIEDIRTQLGSSDIASDWEEGLSMSLEQAVTYASESTNCFMVVKRAVNA